MDTNYVRMLYEYDRWANTRMLDCASKLKLEQFTRSLGSSFGSVRDSVVHMYLSEWVWLKRWNGVSPTSAPPDSDFPDVSSLREKWLEVQKGQHEFLVGLSVEDLDTEITYQNLRGETKRYPLWQMMVHVVNHSTYHRGQVIGMIRQLGAEAVGTDFLVYQDVILKA